MNDRLYRSRDDRFVGGVCGGLADRFDMDPSLVRILWVVLTFLTGLVPGAILYIVMLIVVPEGPMGEAPFGAPGAPGAGPAPWPATPPSDDAAAAGPGQPDSGPSGAGGPPTGAQAAWVPPAQAYADRRARRSARRGRNDGAVALVFGVILILAGAWFLLRPYLPRFDWDLLWPIGIIAVGVLFIVLAMGRRPPGDDDSAAG
ncbi:MAG TPA: PspC domain-containing protein [Candidatus Limnocylindrales bacterium]|nr:PspC domain-containing protein [Candidatus Limnocylindrales bacterium]